MPDNMIERVALTLAKESGRIDPDAWLQYTRPARAILTAMREPSARVKEAMFEKWGEPASAADMEMIATAMWQAGIDAALAEGE